MRGLKYLLSRRLFVFMALSLVTISANAAQNTLETGIAYQLFEAKQPVAKILWFPSEQGVLPEEEAVATSLSKKGVDVIIPNLFDQYFLPNVPSSLFKVPSKDWVDLIHAAQNFHPQLPLFIVTSNLASAQVVKALVSVQQSEISNVGLILVNPNLYTKTPELGEKANYWPETAQLNLPVYIVQAELSPWRWQLANLQKTLMTGGSDVFLQLQENVRDRYYFRPDALAIEKQAAKQLPQELLVAMQRLAPYMLEKRASALPVQVAQKNSLLEQPKKKSENSIQTYQGNQHLPLRLLGLNGKKYDIKQYKGKVVLLNFWASWCPPCVHEMPSMARLKTKMKGEPFEILAVNLAEGKPAIKAFTQAHPVNFPILLDPKGSAVQAWKVFAYPSTYILDKKGQIRYALFGGFEWDSPEALQKIQALLNE